MKKKIILVLLFIFLFIFNLNIVKADELVCSYETDNQKIDLNIDNKTISINGQLVEKKTGGFTTLNFNYNAETLQEYLNNISNFEKCFSLYVCHAENYTQGPGGTTKVTHNYYFFPSEVEFEKYKKDYENKTLAHFNPGTCDFLPEYNSGSTEKKCPTFEYYEQDLEKKGSEYLNCQNDNSCRIKIKSELNSIIDQFKSVCKSIMQYSNYSSECVKKCIELDSTLENIETKYKIKLKNDTNECGFSEKLLAWVNNILRWLKYILPIIVIVFGIIDFIKAIVADKDDEMKKAQKRFITRLIAAALVFIIPYIITFILDKMGFTADSCGIDLFK